MGSALILRQHIRADLSNLPTKITMGAMEVILPNMTLPGENVRKYTGASQFQPRDTRHPPMGAAGDPIHSNMVHNPVPHLTHAPVSYTADYDDLMRDLEKATGSSVAGDTVISSE